MRSGYLLMYSESGDEVHADLITEGHYNKIVTAMEQVGQQAAEEAAFETDPIQGWFTQTYCHEPWPYTDVEILGTVSVCRC